MTQLFRKRTLPLLIGCLLGAVSAQDQATAPALGYKDSFQVNYSSAFLAHVPILYATNPGVHNLGSVLWGAPPPADICMNIYTYRPDSTFINCCSCRVPANSLFRPKGNEIFPTSTSSIAASGATIKVVSTVAPPNPGTCDPTRSPVGVPLGTPNGYAAGLRAWGPHSLNLTEEKFSPVALSPGEQQRLLSQCAASAYRCECPGEPE